MTAETAPPVDISVRYFGAAHAAAGADAEELTMRTGATTVRDLVDELSRRNHDLAQVLLRCSYLCDGVAVHDKSQRLQPGNTIDVLPPFAGG